MTYEIECFVDEGEKYQAFRYPAGELQVRILPSELEAIRQAKGWVVTARITNGEVMELLLLASALDEAAYAVHKFPLRKLILPYFPYSRADRVFTPGDCHGLLTFIEALGTGFWNQVVTLDAHSPAITHVAAQSPCGNFLDVSPTPIIESVISLLPTDKDFVVLLPDEGAKRYNIKHPTVQCHKKRDPATGKLSGFEVPPFEQKAALIVDDICDGGGTFIGIADAIADRGVELYLYVTHGIFSQGFQRLREKFKNVYTTDTFPFGHGLNTSLSLNDFLTIIPAGNVIRDAMEASNVEDREETHTSADFVDGSDESSDFDKA